MARLARVEPAARGFELRGGEHAAVPGNVPIRHVSRGYGFADFPELLAASGESRTVCALVLHGFSPKLVSPRDAASILGVNRETIYRLCARRELAHVRVGSAIRIDLAAYLAGA